LRWTGIGLLGIRVPVALKSTLGCRQHAEVRRVYMAVARVTEITSASKKSFDDAIENGISRAHKTLRNVSGAWIQGQKVVVEKGKVVEYRVNMKVTFILEK
jgi:flavin-binding protein dodecin